MILLSYAMHPKGKIPIKFEEWESHTWQFLLISFMVLMGALIVRKALLRADSIWRWSSEGMRSGTLNVPGIVGLGEACRLRQLEMAEDEKAIAAKRDRLQS